MSTSTSQSAGNPAPASLPEPTPWGTNQMAPPAGPGAHPHNQAAAQFTPPPYVLPSQPVRFNPDKSPMEHVLDHFDDWTHKAEQLATNIWNNLKIAPSMPEAAMGKIGLASKAFTEGGFQGLYKQTFRVNPDENVKTTFACYLSTSAGPVAGTIYLTNIYVAFCSDRPLSFASPCGEPAWGYYKVQIPLERILSVNPVKLKANEQTSEKYIHIVTVDDHDFWFMGFIYYEKAVQGLVESVAEVSSEKRAELAREIAAKVIAETEKLRKVK